MTRSLLISGILVCFFACAAQAQDLTSGGVNSWIFHTPDDSRRDLFIAPFTNGSWNWRRQTIFRSDGSVKLSGFLHTQGIISGNPYNNRNAWIFDTPMHGALTIAPGSNGKWNYGKKTLFRPDGSVDFSGTINVSGNINVYDIVSRGSNSWIFHTPDDTRRDLFIAPSTNGTWDWDWGKQTIFRSNGSVKFAGPIHAEHLISGNSNSWVFFTPDGGSHLSIAPLAQNGQWDWSKQIIFSNNGQVIIGPRKPTSENNWKLAVDGKIMSTEVKVTAPVSWADYVFEPNYKLAPLEEVEKYILQNKHLPEVPSTKEVEQNGINLGDMDAILLKKIEELTLYMIEMKKENATLKATNQELINKINGLAEQVNQVRKQ